MNRKFLVRLYPRAWRKRYGQEFELLLETTPLSARAVTNVCAAAGREWLLRTVTARLLMGPAVAYLALLIAQVLSATVAAEPTFSYETGVRLVWPPWPVRLGVFQALIGFAVVARFAVGFTRRLPMGGAELAVWVLALAGASACWQWGWLIGHRGTGLEPRSHFFTWSLAAVYMTSHLIMLLAGSRGMPPAHKTPSPYTGSSRPLGLS